MSSLVASSPRLPTDKLTPQLFIMFEGFWLILSSTYLLYVSLFLWLSAVVSSYFYFQVLSLYLVINKQTMNMYIIIIIR